MEVARVGVQSQDGRPGVEECEEDGSHADPPSVENVLGVEVLRRRRLS